MVLSLSAAIFGQINDPRLFVAASLGAFGLLAITWAGNLAQWAAHHQVNFFYRDLHSITGLRPDFKFAHNHRRDGELDEAIKATKEELQKDPKNFEGLLMLAQMNLDLNKPTEAVEYIGIILNNHAATESQMELARNEMANCKRLIDLQAVEALNKRSNK